MEQSTKAERLWDSWKQAARTAILINGTGALLVLIFLGHLYTLAQTKKLAVADFMMDLAGAFAALVVGLLLIALQHVFNHISAFFDEKERLASQSVYAVGLLCIVASYGCFAYAAYQIHGAFLDYLPLP